MYQRRPNLLRDEIEKPVLTLAISGIDTTGRIDLGADMTVIPSDVASSLGLNLLPDRSPLQAAFNLVTPFGMVTILVSSNNKRMPIVPPSHY